jgi:hypothetical protein
VNKIAITISSAANVTQSAVIPFGDLHNTLSDGFLLQRIELQLNEVNSDVGNKVISFGVYPFPLRSDEFPMSTMDGAFIFLETLVGAGNYFSNNIIDDLFTPLQVVNKACSYAVRGDAAVDGLLVLYGVYNKPPQDVLALSAFDVPIFPEIKP